MLLTFVWFLQIDFSLSFKKKWNCIASYMFKLKKNHPKFCQIYVDYSKFVINLLTHLCVTNSKPKQ